MTRLELALAGGARDAADARDGVTRGEATRSGLREDQAAAAYSVLTDGRRVSVINAPAGSGKTRVLAEAARAWTAAGAGPVVGVTPSQSARNTLAGGVAESYNSARFLGHLPRRRGARGAVSIGAGTLLLVDEASMLSSRDLADLVSHASASGGKVVLAGDTAQLQAVEDGGAMTLLADVAGYVRLAEPVRFAAGWERAASLRLRDGDVSVLAEYDQRGRIIGGEPEQMMDAAARAYVALTLEGRDVLLMAADHARRRELSRRIREDLVHLGLVADGPSARIAGGARVSAGDLIVCTRNDHRVEAGEPGRALANGDLLRVEELTGRGLRVRQAVDADPVSGVRRWTERDFLYGDYENSELGYAVTDHVAQSRTVHAGLALIAGTEDRQHAYVALTRGTASNVAYVFTVSPKIADPRPGERAASELERFDQVGAYRDGEAAGSAGGADGGVTALGVLAQVVGRDGQELSATAILSRNLSDADHLAVLNAMWQGEVAPARERRYRELLDAALPAGYRGEDSHRARWLWRTLRAAELAGLDPEEVLRAAIAERELTGARDVAAVIDARIRARTGSLVPVAVGSWAEQVPVIADPERRRFANEIAAMMDDRKKRIGEHAARRQVGWAVNALGAVPDQPAGRVGWQERVADIGAYRELYGYDHPDDPIGPEPAGDTPDRRAAWHQALAALGPVSGMEVRGLPDGALLHLRDTYPVETAWAPKWVGDQVRQVRLGAGEAWQAAVRAEAEARAARGRGDRNAAARHQALVGSYHAMGRAYGEREQVLAGVMEDRAEWERATFRQRRLAAAADAELRRRHSGERFEPLRSAEPGPVTDAENSELTLAPGQPIPEIGQWIKDLAAGCTTFASQLADRQSLSVSAEALGYSELAETLAIDAGPGRDALIQPPKPQIQPSARVLQRARERQADLEAVD